ncbi:MAG TPA: NAD(P)H-dependent glycerol-3-phosphate dehydrogenase [Polyangiaceae bacterium]|jgi:glycerol-3-phosphate dehydrogenase (NAD(P)+)
MRVAVVGAGAWGTALACHAARLDHAVALWALEPEVAEDVERRRENRTYLAGVTLPAMRASADVAQVVGDAELVVLVPPSEHLRRVSTAVAPALPGGALVVVATKGIEESTRGLMSDVLAETLPAVGPERLAFLSGPSFAREVASGLPTDVVAASRDMGAARDVQAALHSPMFRVYASGDVIGVQVGGAVKNVIAIAAGACDGLSLGLNARAALTTRGLAEMSRLGVALGADPLTFLGLAGVGDLFLTCGGELSRNRQLGMAIAKGEDPQAYVASHRSVAEGFRTSAAAWSLASARGVDMPITEQVHRVLHRGLPLLDAFRNLVTRAHKEELLGIRP